MSGVHKGARNFLQFRAVVLRGVIEPVVLVAVVVAICGGLLVEPGEHLIICGGTNTE